MSAESPDVAQAGAESAPVTGGSPPVLEVTDASKAFGSVQALAGVSLEVREREIVALLGDNGAGKSTLIKAISGAFPLDSGEIRFGGNLVTIRSPHDARRLGIETVYQDLGLFDNLTASQNFFAGREKAVPSWLGPLAFLQDRAMRAAWADQANRLRVIVKRSDQEVGVMSGGQRQAIAVARAVAFAKRLVILDEPTAALGIRESREVLNLVQQLPDAGVSVILISHNLDHVQRVADRAVVLRQGRNVGEAPPTASNHEYIVSLIVGATQEAGRS